MFPGKPIHGHNGWIPKQYEIIIKCIQWMHTYTLDLPKGKQRTNQYTHIQTPVNVYIYIYIFIHTHTYIYIYTYIDIYIYIHIIHIMSYLFSMVFSSFTLPSALQRHRIGPLLRLPGGVLAAPLPCAEVPEGPGAAARGRGHRGGHGSAWAPPGVGSYKNPWLVMMTIIGYGLACARGFISLVPAQPFLASQIKQGETHAQCRHVQLICGHQSIRLPP